MSSTIGTIQFQHGWDIIGSDTYRYNATTYLHAGEYVTGIYDTGYCFRHYSGQITWSLKSTVNDLTFCTHLKINNGHAESFYFGTLPSEDKIRVKFNGTTRRIELYTGSNAGTLVATSSNLFPVDTWMWVNIYVNISDSIGAIEVRIDNSANTTFVSYSGDTKPGSTTGVDYFKLLSENSYQYLDNMFIHSGTSYPDNFISERRILTLVPTGNGGAIGGATGFVPSSGSYWSTVDELSVNTGDYNSSSTVGAVDVFSRNSTGVIANIDSIDHVMIASKDDVSDRYITSLVQSNGNIYESANIQLSATIKGYDIIRQINPDTSSAWNQSEADSAKFGYKDKS